MTNHAAGRSAIAAALAVAACLPAQEQRARLQEAAFLDLCPERQDPAERRLRLPVQRCAFSGDSRWLVAMREDCKLVFHDLRTGAQKTCDLDPRRPPRAVLPSRAGVEVPVWTGERIDFYNPELGKSVREVVLPAAARATDMCAALSADGRTLWTGHCTVDLLRPERPPGMWQDDIAQGIFDGHGSRLLLRAKPVHMTLGTSAPACRVEICDFAKEERTGSVSFGGPPASDLCFTADARVMVCRSGQLELWSNDLNHERTLPVTAWFARPLSRTAAVVVCRDDGKHGKVRLGLLDFATGRLWHEVECRDVTGLEASGNGRHIALMQPGAVRLFRVQ